MENKEKLIDKLTPDQLKKIEKVHQIKVKKLKDKSVIHK
jgi:hypothetical protein